MRIITIDGSGWKTTLDFYHALYAGIEAPKNAACNVNALLEYMVWGDMGALEPPYRVDILGTANVPSDVLDYVKEVQGLILEHRQHHIDRDGTDVEVSIHLPP